MSMSVHGRYGCLALALLVGAACSRTPQGAAAPAAGASAHAAESTAAVSDALAGHTFATLPDRGELVAYASGDVRRDGAYTWHRAKLSEAYALRAIADGHLRLTTPSGQLLDIQYDDHVEHDSGDWTWVGHAAGHPEQQTILTFGPHAAFGTIAQPNGLPLRLTLRNGASWIVETDPRKIAALHNAAADPKRPDFHVPPKTHPGATAGMQMAAAPVMAAAASSTATVDVVLGYSPGFAADHGGTSGAVTRLNYLVDVANTAYTNSGINAKVRLVHAMQVTYTDSSSNDSTLQKLTGYDTTTNHQTTPDPAFNALRAARDQYGADLVSLVRSYRDPENDGCGIAWLIGGGQSGISTSDSYFGYSVVSDGTDAGTDGHTYYCLDETLAHEMGHNMGAAHDVETSKGDDGTLDPEDYGAYSYSFGYKTTTSTGNFYTIMAYGDAGQTLYRIFSDPRSTFCGGRACGTTTQADNARTLSQTIPTITAFRASASQPVPARVLLRSLDTNGNGKSDLLLFNHGANRVDIWFMSGTTRQAYTATSVSGALSLVDTGDFNGDRRTDLLFENPSTHQLVMGISSGVRYTLQTLPYTYSSSVSPIGVGDVNGNGRGDILLRNRSTGAVTVWYMDGATRTAYNSGAFPIDYVFIGSAYIDGDHRKDLLWARPTGQLIVSLSTGTQFANHVLASNIPSGYDVAGLQDVNGNGRADILFTSDSGSRLLVWYMDGATRSAYNSHALDSNYRLVGKGDMNGDHRGDLVMSNPSTREIKLLLSAGTSFSTALLPDVPASGFRLMDVQ
jgi:hypothetical protein